MASNTASPVTRLRISCRSSTQSTASPTTSKPRSATPRSPTRFPSWEFHPPRWSSRSRSARDGRRVPRRPGRTDHLRRPRQPRGRHPRDADRNRRRHGTAQLSRDRDRGGRVQVRWRITGDGQNSSWVSAADGTVGAGPDTVALTVTAPNTDHDGFVQLGNEYSIEVEWLEGTETNNAALPPRTPQSLQSLAKEVTKVLGLPSGALRVRAGRPGRPRPAHPAHQPRIRHLLRSGSGEQAATAMACRRRPHPRRTCSSTSAVPCRH